MRVWMSGEAIDAGAAQAVDRSRGQAVGAGDVVRPGRAGVGSVGAHRDGRRGVRAGYAVSAATAARTAIMPSRVSAKLVERGDRPMRRPPGSR